MLGRKCDIEESKSESSSDGEEDCEDNDNILSSTKGSGPRALTATSVAPTEGSYNQKLPVQPIKDTSDLSNILNSNNGGDIFADVSNIQVNA